MPVHPTTGRWESWDDRIARTKPIEPEVAEEAPIEKAPKAGATQKRRLKSRKADVEAAIADATGASVDLDALIDSAESEDES